MLDTAVRERPQLIRPDEKISNEQLWALIDAQKSKDQARLSDPELSRLSGIKVEDAEKLAIARQFEATLRQSEETRREKIPSSEKPSDPGGKVVGLKNEGGIFKLDGVWDLMTGWNNTVVEQVHGKMKDVFAGFDLKDQQLRVALELLIAKNYTPAQLEENLTLERIRAKQAAARANERIAPTDVNKYALLYFFTDDLRIREDYVKHFILPDQFKDENQQEQVGVRPRNVEELAWQISWTDDANWGINGKFPLLELRQVPGHETKYYLNKANLRVWVRERAAELLDVSPFSTPDFDNEIKVNKGDFYSLPLNSLYHNRSTFLRSENYDWLDCEEELVRDLQLDSVCMTFSRQAWVTYDKSLRDPKKTMEVVQAIHEMNLVTRRSFGMDMISMLTRMPLRDKGITKPGEHVINDNIVGSAWLDTLLAYEAISDFDRLQEVLGKNSSFFTQKGMLTALEKVHKKVTGHAGAIDAYGFLGQEVYNHLAKAFDKDGKVTTKDNIKNFTQLVNIFFENRQDSNQTEMIRQALRDAMQEKYKFTTGRRINGEEVVDTYSLWMAEILAFSWTNWTGIASYHDRRGIGWNYMTQLMMPGMFRLNRADDNIGAVGNPRNLFMFPQLLVPFLSGIQSGGRTEVLDQTTGNPVGTRRKSATESLHDLQRFRAQQWEYLQQLEKRGITGDALEKEKEKMNDLYLKQSSELRFDQNAAKAYVDDHLNRVDKLWQIINGAEEIDFEKFTTYDPYNFSQPRFDRAKFQEEFINKLIAPVRFAYNVHKDLNFNMMVRVPRIVPDERKDKNGKLIPFKYKTDWQTVPLGKALFGHELLDCKEYWKTTKKGHYEYDKNGRHVIDYNKVNENKLYVWKRWVMCKLAADVQLHRSRDSFDTAKHPLYYESIFAAIESIPGSVWGDEFNMSGVKTPTGLYSKEEMILLKQKALATAFMGEKFARTIFYLGWLWRDIQAKEDEEGMGIGLMFSHIVKGIGFNKQGWMT